jgi:hypothetical protein
MIALNEDMKELMRMYFPVFVYVIEKMYPSHLRLSSDEVHPQWLRLLFMDEASKI